MRINAPLLGYSDQRLIRPGDVVQLGADVDPADVPEHAVVEPVELLPVEVPPVRAAASDRRRQSDGDSSDDDVSARVVTIRRSCSTRPPPVTAATSVPAYHRHRLRADRRSVVEQRNSDEARTGGCSAVVGRRACRAGCPTPSTTPQRRGRCSPSSADRAGGRNRDVAAIVEHDGPIGANRSRASFRGSGPRPPALAGAGDRGRRRWRDTALHRSSGNNRGRSLAARHRRGGVAAAGQRFR